MNTPTSSAFEVSLSQRPAALGPSAALAQAPVQQYRWLSRYGTMLIEVRVDAIYVNGQRVEQAPPSA